MHNLEITIAPAGQARLIALAKHQDRSVENVAAEAVEDALWISIKDQEPSRKEPIVYTLFREGKWCVGIAYWTASQTWGPEAQSIFHPDCFTHWKPLGLPPIRIDP